MESRVGPPCLGHSCQRPAASEEPRGQQELRFRAPSNDFWGSIDEGPWNVGLKLKNLWLAKSQQCLTTERR